MSDKQQHLLSLELNGFLQHVFLFFNISYVFQSSTPLICDTSKTIRLSHRRRASRHSTVTIGALTTRATRTTAHARVLVRNAAVLVDRRGGRDLVVRSRVDADADPSHDAVGDVVAELDPLDEGIHVRGLLAQDRVLGVGRQLLRVSVVGCRGLDERDQVLVEEDLADVRGVRGRGVVAEDGAVGADDGVVGVVGKDVDVGGAWDGVIRINCVARKRRENTHVQCSGREKWTHTEQRH